MGWDSSSKDPQLGHFPLFTGFFTLRHKGLGHFVGEGQGNEGISRIMESFSATSTGFLNTSRDSSSNASLGSLFQCFASEEKG